ncbi:MAG: extracellular solute-binding protein [Halofilum sp. (in: g-proteobacteria)]
MKRIALWCLLFCGAALAADDPEPLDVATWGGVYEASQRKAYFDPFAAETGIPIETASYAGGVEGLREQVGRDNPDWDVIDMTMADHRQACDEGLLEPLDRTTLAAAPDGTPPERDFIEGSFTPCGVAHNVFSVVYAFDKRAFPGAQPYRIEHLFDPERFPGKRAFHRRPDALLEWALSSYGVPAEDLYSLLSTDRGMRLAFERLDRIRDDIVWWSDPAEAVELLLDSDTSFAMGYNGRFFDAAVVRDEPIEIVWDAQVYELEVWGIPRGAARSDLSRRFIRFATRTESLVEQTRHIAYGPTRVSANRRVGEHATAGVLMRPHMPTNPLHMDRAIEKDVAWYARTRDRLDERFDAWLATGEK